MKIASQHATGKLVLFGSPVRTVTCASPLFLYGTFEGVHAVVAKLARIDLARRAHDFRRFERQLPAARANFANRDAFLQSKRAENALGGELGAASLLRERGTADCRTERGGKDDLTEDS
jgi:hypothetical protein